MIFIIVAIHESLPYFQKKGQDYNQISEGATETYTVGAAGLPIDLPRHSFEKPLRTNISFSAFTLMVFFLTSGSFKNQACKS